MISVVCVYNDREALDAYLLKGLETQTTDYDLVLIDNTRRQFRSAAEALNHGGRKAKGRYIMFAHQDLLLESVTCLQVVETTLEALPDLGIAGVAGCIEGIGGTLSNITHGAPPAPAGHFRVATPTRVQTVDECLIVIPREIFSKLPFDEKTCNGWHLYGVDYSLDVRKLGLNAYVLPITAYHRWSLGRVPQDYYTSLKRILGKHRDRHARIFTTCGTWDTRIPLCLQRISRSRREFTSVVRLGLQVLRENGPIQFAKRTLDYISWRFGRRS